MRVWRGSFSMRRLDSSRRAGNGQGSPAITDLQIKHLEFIQGIVTRLSNGSFLIKGWTLTASGIFFGLLAKDLSWQVAMVGFLPIGGFWLLDSYYLRQERLFRKLYDAVRQPQTLVEPFSMNVQPYHREVPWGKVITSHTVRNFYGVIGLANLAFLAVALVKRFC